ncbi:MAG TPA: tRNA (adenosine(37)-N6)-threonylcarbamoyltransferase complex ATPase subunit type 1 TsaE [Deltaproteobacteria bacterium]|nr:tRNA (adenosine(37)-N6)-threonylcarbamoyltransferase complex ATPase subunit type 1 TsaE [Deltaproteobacteria bacterium]
MKVHRWKTDAPAKTIRIGRIIGRWAKIAARRKTVVIFLEGEMGSGKTTFASGIISGAGINTSKFAGSPSYTIANQYEGDLRINHIDFWRYNLQQYNKDMILEEFSNYLDDDITIIEWGKQLEKSIDGYIRIKISGDKKRTVVLTAG